MHFDVAYSEVERMFLRNHIVLNQYTPYQKQLLKMSHFREAHLFFKWCQTTKQGIRTLRIAS